MNLIERVKNIIITPKTEWEVINGETASTQSLLMGYVIPLSLVGALGSVLKGLWLSGTILAGFGWGYFIATAAVAFVASIIAYFITVLIVDMLAPSFGSEKNMGKSAQLVAYSGTPSYIAGLLSFIPILGWLVALAAWIYGIFLMYIGIGPIKKTPEDKKVLYMLVAFLIMVVLYFIIAAILTAIVFSIIGFGAVSLLRH